MRLWEARNSLEIRMLDSNRNGGTRRSACFEDIIKTHIASNSATYANVYSAPSSGNEPSHGMLLNLLFRLLSFSAGFAGAGCHAGQTKA